MLKSLALACLGSYFLLSNCVAQPPDSRQNFQSFGEKIVGGTWHQQLPKNLTSRHTYKWALGHEFLISYRWNQQGPNSLTILGVDPESGDQTAWDFDDEGNVYITVLKPSSMTPTTEKLELSGERAHNHGTVIVQWKDENRTIEIVPQSDANPAAPPVAKEAWENHDETDDLSWVESAAPDKLPEQLSLIKTMNGPKVIDGVMPDGEKFIGGGFGKWVLNGRFHIFTGSVVLDDQTTWSHLVIEGIDPITSKATAWEFTSLGATSKIAVNENGKAIVGDHTQPNGEKLFFEGRFTVDGKILRYQSKIGKKGEQAKPYSWDYRDAN